MGESNSEPKCVTFLSEKKPELGTTEMGAILTYSSASESLLA
jgi:hypothetical protein